MINTVYMSLIMDKRKGCSKLACNKLLLTCCLLLFPLWESVIILCFLYVTYCPFKFFNHLDTEERAGCFA